jgi:alpha-tubulin suppressor-like RCC1 family protein/alpha-beta hydrolase superfamily lysophospholipase
MAKHIGAGRLLVGAFILTNCGSELGDSPGEESTGAVRQELSSSSAGMATGASHTCKIFQGGKILCWGSNSKGQLGDGTTTTPTGPVFVTGITTAISVTAGDNHTCAVLSGGTAKCWGDNGVGQLGNGGILSISKTPVSVSGITTASQLAAGQMHTCARLTNSTVKCWGNGGGGELGTGGNTGSTTPVSVSSMTTATAIAAGGHFTCARLSAGTVSCWGAGTLGAFGTSNSNRLSPSAISGVTGATSISAGNYHACSRISNSTIKCWGNNQSGQVGNGSTSLGSPTNGVNSTQVLNITTATDVGLGGSHSCARLSDGTVKCWGTNGSGQLGNGSTGSAYTPVSVSNVTNATGVSGGGSYSCATFSNGGFQCWGANGSGQIVGGGSATYTTATAPACTSLLVERSDYFVNVTTANMPDSALNGQAASLDVHRVKPVMFPESCPTKALVMVHGRTVEAVGVFDVQYQDYSFQETLANAGIDTFTFNHLGMGRSSGLNVMNNPCNAGLPAATGGQTCPAPFGSLYECYPTPNPEPVNQQGSTRYLNPNPLASVCAHTSPYRFINTAVMVQSLSAVIDDSLAKSGLSKVSLLGYSAGGIDVGNYLGEADNTLRAARTAKIDRAIFLASLFGSPGIIPPVAATEPTNVPTYPIGLLDKGNATGFVDNPACPGQRDLALPDVVWSTLKNRDSVASSWGQAGTAGGLIRYPVASRWGWNTAAAARVTVPTLVMNGLLDTTVAVAASPALYNALTGTTSKTIFQVGCATHQIFYDSCSGGTCNGWNGPHATVAKNVKDWVIDGLIYASPGQDNGSFASTDADGTPYHTDAPITDGPPVDETSSW